MLVKGDAGTGKTTLALEILTTIGQEDCIYFSTRIPPSVLREDYPWLENKVVLGPEEVQFLETRNESPDRLLSMLRDQLLKMERPYLVVDTWNALAVEMDPREQLRTAKALIATTYGMNGRTILVEETRETSFLDFMLDGVVSLSSSDVYGESEGGRVYEDRLERRNAREIELRKLKGIRITNKRYAFTLEGGRFRFLPPFREDLSIRPKKILDPSDDHISTGIADLDSITKGIRKGTLTLFEIEHGVDLRYLQIHTQLAWNAVMNRKGVIVIPSIGELYPHDLVRQVIIYNPQADDFPSEVGKLKETTGKAFNSEQLEKGLVILLGFDTFLSRFGADNALPVIQTFVNYARESGTIVIGTMKRGMKSLEYATHVADNHFVFKDLNNALVLYGMRPKTSLLAISSVEDGVRLTSIV